MGGTPNELLETWVDARSGDARTWFRDGLAGLRQTDGSERDLHIFLGYAPRKLGKADLELSTADLEAAEAAHAGWNPADWSVDGAARVLALLSFRPKRPFFEMFKDLRRTSDVAEMIALYRGLPLYPEPDSLHFEVGEGLRSNLKPVFESIAHRNPYPRDHFDQHRWNHMILKALFVGSDLKPIIGLEERSNPELARILIDYAQERWAAGRPVAEDLWIPVRPMAKEPEIAAALARATSEGHLTEEMLS